MTHRISYSEKCGPDVKSGDQGGSPRWVPACPAGFFAAVGVFINRNMGNENFIFKQLLKAVKNKTAQRSGLYFIKGTIGKNRIDGRFTTSLNSMSSLNLIRQISYFKSWFLNHFAQSI